MLVIWHGVRGVMAACPPLSVEPVDPVERRVEPVVEERSEGADEVVGVGVAAAVEASRRGEDHPAVVVAACGPGPDDAVEVAGVLGDHDPTFTGGSAQEIIVFESAESRVVGRGEDVVALVAQSLCGAT